MGYKLRTFSRIKQFLNTKATLTVCKFTILPIIDYCDIFQIFGMLINMEDLKNSKHWGRELSMLVYA